MELGRSSGIPPDRQPDIPQQETGGELGSAAPVDGPRPDREQSFGAFAMSDRFGDEPGIKSTEVQFDDDYDEDPGDDVPPAIEEIVLESSVHDPTGLTDAAREELNRTYFQHKVGCVISVEPGLEVSMYDADAHDAEPLLTIKYDKEGITAQIRKGSFDESAPPEIMPDEVRPYLIDGSRAVASPNAGRAVLKWLLVRPSTAGKGLYGGQGVTSGAEEDLMRRYGGMELVGAGEDPVRRSLFIDMPHVPHAGKLQRVKLHVIRPDHLPGPEPPPPPQQEETQ